MISSSYKIKTYWNIFYKYGTADTLTADTLTADTLTADTLNQEIFNLSARLTEGSEMQVGAHFTSTRLVRAGISLNKPYFDCAACFQTQI